MKLHALIRQLTLFAVCLSLLTVPSPSAATEEVDAADEPVAAPAATAAAASAIPIPTHLAGAPAHSLPPLPLTAAKAQSLIDNDIVPLHIPAAPSSILKLAFGSELRLAEMGLTVPARLVVDRPRVHYNVRANRFYALFMIDLDAPSRSTPVAAQWLHWLLLNIPGRDLSRGETIVEYVGAAPPEGAGLHRYIVLAVEQSFKIDTKEMARIARTSAEGRAKFSYERFLLQHDSAAKVIALNWWQSEWDSSVPAIHKQLSPEVGAD